jgi:hypothetical protein
MPAHLGCVPCVAASSLLQAHHSALAEVQSQLDQAYNDLSELQFSSDQEKVALEAQLQQAQEQLKVRQCVPAKWPAALCFTFMLAMQPGAGSVAPGLPHAATAMLFAVQLQIARWHIAT